MPIEAPSISTALRGPFKHSFTNRTTIKAILLPSRRINFDDDDDDDDADDDEWPNFLFMHTFFYVCFYCCFHVGQGNRAGVVVKMNTLKMIKVKSIIQVSGLRAR